MEGREAGHLVYELLNTDKPDEGLAALPAPSPGDVFLDLEGDSYAFETGIEYLFGILTFPEAGGEPFYQSLWSFDRAEEKRAFEKFISSVMERWQRHPDMHVYHYAPYEPTAIKRLAGQHAVCIDEVDQLLRAGIFVDLYRVVKQGVRILLKAIQSRGWSRSTVSSATWRRGTRSSASNIRSRAGVGRRSGC